MDDFVFGPDRIYAAMPLEAEANKLTIIDPDDGVLVATVTPRARYYNHLDDDADGTYGYSLLRALEDAINTHVSTSTYTIRSATPAGSELLLSGIELVRDAGGAFSIDFGQSTLDPRLLGWGVGESSTRTSDADGVLASPYSLWGVWQSYTIEGHAAASKDKDPYQNIELSSDDVAAAIRKKYLDKTFRTLRYDYVPGAHVRENRAMDQASANTGGLPRGDVHNSLEAMWPLLTAGDGDERLAEMIIVHDAGGDGHEWVFRRPYELARLSDKAQIQRFKECRELLLMAGEYYRVEFSVDVSTGTYEQ